MKMTGGLLLLVWSITIGAVEVSAQQFLSGADLAFPGKIAAPLFPRGNGWVTAWYSEKKSNRLRIVERQDGVLSDSCWSLPGRQYEYRALAQTLSFYEGRGWYARGNELYTATSLGNWKLIHVDDNGRSIVFRYVTSGSSDGALVVGESFIARRIDSGSCSLTCERMDIQGFIMEVGYDTTQRTIQIDHKYLPASNALRLDDGVICVALTVRQESRNTLALIDRNGITHYVHAPADMPSNCKPNWIVRTEDKKIYAFYRGTERLRGNGSMVVYDEVRQLVSWHPFPAGLQSVVHAAAVSPSKIVGHAGSHIVTIEGVHVSGQECLHPTTGQKLTPVGVSVVGDGMVAYAFAEGVFFLP
jgi:hypothetical protein